ncbi:hypothetical protein [Streptomyces nigrescens]
MWQLSGGLAMQRDFAADVSATGSALVEASRGAWLRAATFAVKGGSQCRQGLEKDDFALFERGILALRSARHELDEVQLRLRHFGIRTDRNGPSGPARR